MSTSSRQCLKRASATLVLLAAAAPVRVWAADNHFADGVYGKWENAGNWSLGAPSSSDTNDDVDGASGSTAIIDSTTTGSFPSTLTISNLNILNGTLSGNNVTVYADADPTVPLTIQNQLTVDGGASMNVYGGAVSAADADFGDNGVGTLTLDGGSFGVAGDLHFGRYNGGAGYCYLAAGTLSVVGTEYVGEAFSTVNAVGNFTQYGGVNTVANQLHIGDQDTGAGNYLMTGGTLSVTNGIVVGDVGTFNQLGGTVNLLTGGGYGNLTVSGYYHLANSDGPAVLNVAGSEYIGANNGTPGQGVFVQDSGSHQITGNLTMARYSGSTASYTLNGGSVSAVNCYVAGDTGSAGGTATLTINGGTATIGSLANGTLTGTTHIWPGGTFQINPGGTLVTGTMINDGVINDGGGQYFSSGTITGSGVISQSGGNITLANLTNISQGMMQISGGTATGTGTTLVGATTGSGTGNATLSISGGTTTFGILGVANNGTVTSGSGSGAVFASAGSLYADTVLLGSTSGGSGSMTISGTASVTIGGGLNFNDLTVHGGSLVVLDQTPPPGEDPELNYSIVGGYLRNGAMTVDGGNVTSPDIKLGITSGYTGSFTQSGGTVSVNILSAGNDATLTSGSGTGIINVSGGTLVASTVLLGSTVGGSGSMTVSGTADVIVGGGLQLNDLTVNGGSVVVLDQTPPPGEDPELNRSMVGGYMRNGAMTVSGGVVTSPNIKLGITSGYTGTMSVSGGTVNVGTLSAGSDATISSGMGMGLVNVSGGTLNAGTVILGSTLGGAGTFIQSAGLSSVGFATVGANGTIGVSGGIVNVGRIGSAGALSVSGGTLAFVNAGSLGTGSITSMKITGNGVVDIGSSAFVMPYSGASPIGEITPNGHTQNYPANSIQRYIQTASDGGLWDEPGLTSSAAENDPFGQTGVGALDQNDLNNLEGQDYTGGTWMGLSITSDNTVLVRETYYGDTDLNGTVDSNDVNNLEIGYAGLGDGWVYGDFNYDGVVDAADVNLLDLNYGSIPLGDVGTLTSAQVAWLLATEKGLTPQQIAAFEAKVVLAVPEPVSIGMLGVGAVGLLGRRRR